MKIMRQIFFILLLFFSFLNSAHAIVYFNAQIDTVEKGLINAVWKKGGESTTARGDSVVWGYFYASPNDVSWGNENNPDVFVKIWFDASGRIDVNFFHVSVPDIYVYAQIDNKPQLKGRTTLNERYVRHYFMPSGFGQQNTSTERTSELVEVNNYTDTGDTVLPVSTASIYTDELGIIDAEIFFGETGSTQRGDSVLWGYFYASPNDVSWGNQNNPEVFFKIWRDAPTLRYDVNFFHVSVPDVKTVSQMGYFPDNSYSYLDNIITDSIIGLNQRYARHEYYYQRGNVPIVGFQANYPQPRNPTYQAQQASYREDNFIGELADALNQGFIIPENVTVQFAECGFVNAFYSPSNKSITFCFELLDKVIRDYVQIARDIGVEVTEDSIGEATGNFTITVLFHELAHALVDVLQLPFTGKEENFADQFSTWFLMSSDDIDLQEAVLDTALIFLFWGDNTPKNYADTHSLGEQRFYDLLCWAYGYNPRSNVGQDAGFFLPESRKARCTDEWQQLDRGMTNLLEPHVRQ